MRMVAPSLDEAYEEHPLSETGSVEASPPIAVTPAPRDGVCVAPPQGKVQIAPNIARRNSFARRRSSVALTMAGVKWSNDISLTRKNFKFRRVLERRFSRVLDRIAIGMKAYFDRLCMVLFPAFFAVMTGRTFGYI